MTRWSLSRRTIGGLLIAAAIVLLGVSAIGMRTAMSNADELSRRADASETLAQANIRAQTQMNRHLLLLRLQLTDDTPDRAAIVTRTRLLTRQATEAALPVQMATLGDPELLRRTRAFRDEWHEEIRPLVLQWADQEPGADRARARAIERIISLEGRYNDVVTVAESNRLVLSADANQATQAVVRRMTELFYIVFGTYATSLLVFAGGTYLIRRLLRQREEANDQLRAANEDLESAAAVLRATNSMVAVLDSSARITWTNEALQRVSGYDAEELLGSHAADLLQGQYTSHDITESVEQAVRSGSPFTHEIAYTSREGEEVWVSITGNRVARSVRDTHYVLVATDITERKSAEQILENARITAEATARERAGFLAVMSHEIRTPLNAVLGLTDLLRLTDLDSQQRRFTQAAHRSGEHLLALLNGVLDFSALESGELSLEERRFMLRAVVDDSVAMFESSARRQGLELRARIDADVPAAVLGDAVRLRQILVNLIGNAVKFTPQGSVTVSVDLASDEPDPPLGTVPIRVRVQDTGIGIDPDSAGTLFQPFRQGDTSTTRRFGGTGLGLAICRQIAELMGGRIGILEEPDRQGTTIEAILPMAPSVESGLAENPVPAAPSEPSSVAPDILVAEDDVVNQTVILHMLRRLGIEPTIVENGRLAVAAASAHRFDIVLLDLQMPDMDGFEAARGIRDLPDGAHPHIVAVTADASRETRRHLSDTGIDGYLGKPLTLAGLEELLVSIAPPGAIRRV